MKIEELTQRYEAGERDFRKVVVEKEYLGLLKVNLRGADLSGVNLKGADLATTDFRGANLSDANLEGANLEASILDEADLSRVNLRGANLTNGRFWKAKLREAILKEATLRNTSFREADLSRADLTRTNLSRTSLAYANLEEADLRQTMFYAGGSAARHGFCVNASHANLRGAKVGPGFPVELADVRPDGTETKSRHNDEKSRTKAYPVSTRNLRNQSAGRAR
jgi:uncharacterized protein YjbI with pentapeptide repeats